MYFQARAAGPAGSPSASFRHRRHGARDTLQFLEALGRPYLHKPFTLAELRAALGHAAKQPPEGVRVLHVDSGRDSGAVRTVRLLAREAGRKPGVEQRLVTGAAASWRAGPPQMASPCRRIPWALGLDPRAGGGWS